MYYENSLTITLKNEKTAAAALEIMKTRLVTGFDYDKGYKRVPSMLMHDTLEVEDNTVILTEEFGCYFPNHAEAVIPELMQYLATHLSTEAFTFESVNSGDYDESWINGSYENGELKIKSTFLPAGFGDFYCPACGEVIASMNDDTEGNIFVEYKEGACSECSEEIDYSEWLPVITEKTFQII